MVSSRLITGDRGFESRFVSDPAVRPAAHPDLFGFGRHVDLLVPGANAGHGSAAILPATRIRLRRSGDRAADDRMAGRAV